MGLNPGCFATGNDEEIDAAEVSCARLTIGAGFGAEGGGGAVISAITECWFFGAGVTGILRLCCVVIDEGLARVSAAVGWGGQVRLRAAADAIMTREWPRGQWRALRAPLAQVRAAGLTIGPWLRRHAPSAARGRY
jgi:hypothetical protein